MKRESEKTEAAANSEIEHHLSRIYASEMIGSPVVRGEDSLGRVVDLFLDEQLYVVSLMVRVQGSKEERPFSLNRDVVLHRSRGGLVLSCPSEKKDLFFTEPGGESISSLKTYTEIISYSVHTPGLRNGCMTDLLCAQEQSCSGWKVVALCGRFGLPLFGRKFEVLLDVVRNIYWSSGEVFLSHL